MPEESCCAILVAAGNSSRMGMGMSKQFLLLGGEAGYCTYAACL